ncbi:MAG: sugar ABC transporter ATP-binding protein [Lachnospiraceae bacterium]
MSQKILTMSGIEKSFAVPVLKGVEFSLKKGEIHALVGGNGAGKSTLMKIMTGVYSKDAGEIFIDGSKVEINNTNDAKANGIAMIYQELSLIQTMTVAENIFLGEEITRNGMRDTKAMNELAKKILNELGIQVEPDIIVSQLSVGLSQMIEIAKAVSKKAKILVFDEPTASLSDSETKQLFRMMDDLKQKGVSMVYISHRMNEILEIADSITILRDGFVVHTDDIKNITLETIISHMLGNTGGKKFDWVERAYDVKGKDLLTVDHIKISEKIKDISFSLKKGEILGLAGLMGSGRTEILETLFGLRKAYEGAIKLNGKQILIKSPQDAVKFGLALIPEDRRKQGLVSIHTVKENAVLPRISRLCKKTGMIDEKKANQIVEENVKQLNIITDGIHKRINLLSGGNQQKVVIAKWLNMNPEIMMLDEPTAGVDIGAKVEIIELMRQFADKQKGVIFVSSEISELMAVCDRIIVLYNGKITGEIARKEIKTEEELQHAIQQTK